MLLEAEIGSAPNRIRSLLGSSPDDSLQAIDKKHKGKKNSLTTVPFHGIPCTAKENKILERCTQNIVKTKLQFGQDNVFRAQCGVGMANIQKQQG